MDNLENQSLTSAPQTNSVVWTSSSQPIMSTGAGAIIPTTCLGGQTTSTTTMTVSYTVSRPTGTIPKSPLDDPRVGWIHELPRETLVREMEKYGLWTAGNVAELRKRFCKFWAKPPTPDFWQNLGQPTTYPSGLVYSEPATMPSATDATAHWVPSTRQDYGASANPYEHEYGYIREILGLSPNADSHTLQRTLVNLVRGSQPPRGNPQPNQTFIQPPNYATQNDNSVPTTTRTLLMPTIQPESYPQHAFAAPNLTLPQPNQPAVDTAQVHSGGLNLNRGIPSLCDAVRKWNLRFDGHKDPVSFLERLEELMEAYTILPDEILKALPEFFHGSALLWYRNMRDSWVSLDQFKRSFESQFLPPGYRRNLDQEIRKRTQGENEPFRDFVVALSTLVRRAGNFSNHQKLELIFTNMRPEYKLMVRRQDFGTLNELIEKAEEFEAYERDRRSFRPPPPPSQALVVETAYSHRRRVEKSLDVAALTDDREENRSRHETSTWVRPNSKVDVQTRNGAKAVTTRSGVQTSGDKPPERKLSDSSSGKTNQIVCWNCDQTGHSFRECRRPKVLRCFYCKKEGIATMHCDCPSGNARRTQPRGGRLSPSPKTVPSRPPTNGPNGSKQ